MEKKKREEAEKLVKIILQLNNPPACGIEREVAAGGGGITRSPSFFLIRNQSYF